MALFIIFSNQSCKKEIKAVKGEFTHGVASGDPSQTGVLLWTRFLPQDSLSKTKIEWEVSKDKSFINILKQGQAHAEAENDHCIKVFVEGLNSGSEYYYRFKVDNQYSVIGQTQTLPNNTDRVKLAIVNCSKFEGGFFNVYDAISKIDGINAVIHLGDYIYEDAGGQEPYIPIVKNTGRSHQPAHKLVSLEDYRTRYAQYRADSMTLKLHQKYPMINIWDDHESANNSWSSGAQAHDSIKDGDWFVRKDNAIKAYHEWIPINIKQNEPIYRSFQFGNILNLNMLDTRLCCRTQQAKNDKQMDSIALYSNLLGDEQLNWLEKSINEKDTKWNLIGNQVLVARQYLEQDVNYISYDQWTGYPKDRSRFLKLIKENPSKNVIITTGNMHDAFHFEILDSKDERSGNLIAHELLPGSVSSGNSFVKKSKEELEDYKEKLEDYNPHLKWFDLIKHSFIIIEFTENNAQADWYQVSTTNSTSYNLEKVYSLNLIIANHNSTNLKTFFYTMNALFLYQKTVLC